MAFTLESVDFYCFALIVVFNLIVLRRLWTKVYSVAHSRPYWPCVVEMSIVYGPKCTV